MNRRRTADVAVPAAERPLAQLAVGGVLWQATSYLAGKLVVLVATVVLARLLAPREFGLVGLALVFIGYADVMSDLGVAQALIYYPRTRRRTDAALAVATLSAGVLMAVFVAAAPSIAGFFGRADLVPLLRVLSLTLLLGATGSVPEKLLIRELRFRRVIWVNLARAVALGSVSVGLAVAGLGVWALVWGQLAGELGYNVAGWSQAGHRPDLRWWRLRTADLGPLVGYGGVVAVSMLLTKVTFDLDYLMVGKVLGATALGLYTLAFRMPELLVVNMFVVIASVAFPLYARAAADRRRLARGWLRSLRLQSVYGATAGVALAVLAPVTVTTLFGDRWEPSVAPLRWLGLYAVFRSLGGGANDVFKSLGRPRLALTMSLLRLAAVTPALALAVGYGITAVATAQAVTAAVYAGLLQVVVVRLLGVPVRDLAAALRPAALAGAGTAVGAGLVLALLSGPDAVVLASGLATGGLLAGAALWWGARPFARDTLALLRLRAGTATRPVDG